MHFSRYDSKFLKLDLSVLKDIFNQVMGKFYSTEKVFLLIQSGNQLCVGLVPLLSMDY